MAMDYQEMERDLIRQVRTGDGAVTSGYFAGRQVLLLTTTGSVSGEHRVTPLVYSRDGGDLIIIASAGGSPKHPAWYKNLLKQPEVTIETGGQTFEARAIVVNSEAERRRIYDQHAELHDSFTTYEALTDGRVIPVIRLERVAVPV
jgi:deazaflavin-dependent oxidoreductase (nitroreductase family)